MVRPFKVLLVDDDPGEHTLFTYAMKLCGVTCDFEHAYDGNQALQMLKSDANKDIQLVFLDLNMPGMNGRETLRQIKSDVSLEALPVLILTTSGQDSDKAYCRDHGADGYIVKNVDLDAFSETIHGVLDAFMDGKAATQSFWV